MGTYSYGLGSKISPSTFRELGNTLEVYGRVVRVVLGESSPDFNKFGGTTALGGIRYRVVGEEKDETDVDNLPFAFFGDTTVKTFPVAGEIVKIFKGPSEVDLSNNTYPDKFYYTSIVNLFGEVNSNRYPDTFRTNLRTYNDPNAPFVEGVMPLVPRPGDTILEGRLGSSVRLGGYLQEGDALYERDNTTSPYFLLKVGRGRVNQRIGTSVEDINLDDASIYLLSNHRIPFKPSTVLNNTFKTPPDGIDTYKGKQILINSDRIVLNAKKDHILFLSGKSVGLQGRTVNLEAREYVGINAHKIFLGKDSIFSKNPQPVVLGLENEKVLQDFLEVLENLGNSLTSLTPSPVQITAQLHVTGTVIGNYVKSIRSKLPSIKSKKVFTD